MNRITKMEPILKEQKFQLPGSSEFIVVFFADKKVKT